MSSKNFSRRDFLKVGCLTTAAAGSAVCGISAAIPIPEEYEMNFHSTSEVTDRANRTLVAYASGFGSTAVVQRL